VSGGIVAILLKVSSIPVMVAPSGIENEKLVAAKNREDVMASSTTEDGNPPVDQLAEPVP